MWNWFKNLSTIWKIVLIAGIFVIALFIYDLTTGGISDLKGWMFDRRSAERTAENEKLTKENDALRAENVELEKKIVADEAKYTILVGQDKELTAKQQEALAKTDQALQQQAQEEAITAQEIDNHTRCVRTKEKMVALGIPHAKEMNCDEVK